MVYGSLKSFDEIQFHPIIISNHIKQTSSLKEET